MMRIRFIRLFDLLLKLIIVSSLAYLLNYTSQYIRKSFDYGATVTRLKQSVNDINKKQGYINDTKRHIQVSDLTRKADIYNVIAKSTRGLSNVFVIATSISEVDPIKNKLIAYKTGRVTAYRVNVIVQGGLLEVRSIMNRLARNLPNIFWQEVIIDSKKFPSKYASLTFYVLSH